MALKGSAPLREESRNRFGILMSGRDFDEIPRIEIRKVMQEVEQLATALGVREESEETIALRGQHKGADERGFVIHRNGHRCITDRASAVPNSADYQRRDSSTRHQNDTTDRLDCGVWWQRQRLCQAAVDRGLGSIIAGIQTHQGSLHCRLAGVD
jgi:hypothetical protein